MRPRRWPSASAPRPPARCRRRPTTWSPAPPPARSSARQGSSVSLCSPRTSGSTSSARSADGAPRTSATFHTNASGPHPPRCRPEFCDTRSLARGSEVTSQRQYDDDDQNKPESTAWSVAPTATVTPVWQRADQRQDQHNNKNRRKHVLGLVPVKIVAK